MIRREVTFPATPEQLWELLTEPSSVSSWFGSRVDWELTPGGDASFKGGDQGDRQGRVETVDPQRRLRFSWWPTTDRSQASEVTYVLEPTEEGTRLIVTEARAAATATSRAACSAWDLRMIGAWCQAGAATASVAA
jgi:uncharacterized protein YndB with AHSA1/START domain